MTFHLYLSDNINNNNLIVYCIDATRVMSLVDQDLLILPDHLRSYRVLSFYVLFCTLIMVFLVVFGYGVVGLFSTDDWVTSTISQITKKSFFSNL